MRFLTAAFAGILTLLPLPGFQGTQQAAPSVDPPGQARMVLEAQGRGFQIYSCRIVGGSPQWALLGPDAKLYSPAGQAIGTHFAGPTWKLTDGSQVQGQLAASRPSPDPASAAWLLLRAKPGTASGALSKVAWIRRTETHGGAATPAGCRTPADEAKTEKVPYSAAYTFYSAQ